MNLSPNTFIASRSTAESSPRAASYDCVGLPDFDRRNLEAVRSAFSQSPVLPLRQPWLEKEEIDFAPGLIRIGWREASLLVFAEMKDADICTWAEKSGKNFWELGELLEIFLRPDGQEGYSEFHVTPQNQKSQLRYNNAWHAENLRKSGSFGEALVKEPAFNSQAWIKAGENQWFVFAEIPASVVGEKVQSLAGSQWHFSFGRYDYTRGREQPVISSTSAHQLPDFHRQQEWALMTFAGLAVIKPLGNIPPSAPVSLGQ